jgi:hypothetical protein
MSLQTAFFAPPTLDIRSARDLAQHVVDTGEVPKREKP